MSIRKIKDAKDLTSNELIYFKSHAKATYMSDGATVEDAIKARDNINADWSELNDESAAFIKNKPEIPDDQIITNWGFTKNTGNYSLPIGGIPKNDLHQDVRNSLSKADSALQELSEESISAFGFTKNEGTITEIQMNDESIGTSGVIDLGQVLRPQNINGFLGYNTFVGYLTVDNPILSIDNVSNLPILIYIPNHTTNGSKYELTIGEYINVDATTNPPYTIYVEQTSLGAQIRLDAPAGIGDNVILIYKDLFVSDTIAKSSELATVATSGSYNDLNDIPSIPSETTIENWGFAKTNNVYSKPDNGIPLSDLDNEIQTTLQKADTAVQPEDILDEVVIGDSEPQDADIWIDTSEGSGDSETDTNTPILDAPADGKSYVRKNNAWSDVSNELSDYVTKDDFNAKIQFVTQAEYMALGNVVNSNGVIYFITE